MKEPIKKKKKAAEFFSETDTWILKLKQFFQYTE